MINEASLDKLRKDIRKDIQGDIKESIDDVLMVVKELAQFTSDGFGQLNDRMDKLENRMDKSEQRTTSIESILDEHSKRFEKIESTLHNHTSRFAEIDSTLNDHTMRFAEVQSTLNDIAGKQDAHYNDIVELYKIAEKHENQQKLSTLELKDAELRINRIISWAKSTSKTLNIPINIQ